MLGSRIATHQQLRVVDSGFNGARRFVVDDPRNVQQFRLALWAVGLFGPMVITEETTHPLAAPHPAGLRLNL